MISNERLPSSLAGIESMAFFEHWNVVKDKINDILGLGNDINNYILKLRSIQRNVTAKGRPDLAALLNEDINKAKQDYDKWLDVRAKIREWLPKWLIAAESNSSIVSQPGLGIAPVLVIAPAAIAALAFVVREGMRLLSDYKFKKSVVEDIKKKNITASDAKQIIEAAEGEGIFAGMGGALTGLGMLVVAVALFFPQLMRRG